LTRRNTGFRRWLRDGTGPRAFLTVKPFQDDADFVLGGMVLARGTANVAHQLFGWYPCGRGGEFVAHLHSPWGYDEPEILRYSNRQFGPKGADAGHAAGLDVEHWDWPVDRRELLRMVEQIHADLIPLIDLPP
jgi:hypothetical protein